MRVRRVLGLALVVECLLGGEVEDQVADAFGHHRSPRHRPRVRQIVAALPLLPSARPRPTSSQALRFPRNRTNFAAVVLEIQMAHADAENDDGSDGSSSQRTGGHR
jgi:hypothetical protein